jgi:thiamine pyrophosphate-dependent acetolactate synthase large subunit-like protein
MLVIEAIAHELSRRGVKIVFGIPGRESVQLGVELDRLGIEFCSARHETQAVMMADGYWRASGQIGVVVLAQGVGFANGAPGMACAAKAGSGIVVIAGDLLTSGGAETDPKAKALRQLKCVNHVIVCEGIGIKSVTPTSAETFLPEFRAVLDLAQSGVAISLNIPSDMFSARIGPDVAAGAIANAAEPASPDPEEIEAVAELLATPWAVSRPVIVAGRGAVRSGALPALRRLAELTGALLATSLHARSSFRGHPYNIGICGTFSTPVGGQLLTQADCILVFGASLNPFTTYQQTIFPKKAHIIHIDRAKAALGKYLDPELAIEADARLFAEGLVAELERRGHQATGFHTADVARDIAAYDSRSEFNDKSTNGFIDPRTLMVELNEILPKERVLVIDTGAHLHFACAYLDVERSEDFVLPVDSLAVGLGMGAAVGAATARPDRTTVFEVGEGGFMMALGDLDTAVRRNLPIVIVVSNDQAWGAEAQHLRHLGMPDDYVRMRTPSLAAVAEAMGAQGYTITSPEDLRAIADRLRQRPDGPVVLDCRVDPDIQPAPVMDYARISTR